MVLVRADLCSCLWGAVPHFHSFHLVGACWCHIAQHRRLEDGDPSRFCKVCGHFAPFVDTQHPPLPPPNPCPQRTHEDAGLRRLVHVWSGRQRCVRCVGCVTMPKRLRGRLMSGRAGTRRRFGGCSGLNLCPRHSQVAITPAYPCSHHTSLSTFSSGDWGFGLRIGWGLIAGVGARGVAHIQFLAHDALDALTRSVDECVWKRLPRRSLSFRLPAVVYGCRDAPAVDRDAPAVDRGGREGPPYAHDIHVIEPA
jgi:hypothetical protein